VTAIINSTAFGGFRRAAQRRRVDIAIIGDSNMKRNQVTGHAQGMTYAWSAALGCWGAAIMPFAGTTGGWGAVSGDVSAGGAVGLSVGGDFSSAPSAFQAALLPQSPAYFPCFGDYITNWSSTENALSGYSIRSQHPLNIARELRYSARVYIPASGAATALNPAAYTDLGGGIAGATVHPGSASTLALPGTEGFHTVSKLFAAMAPTDGTGLYFRLQRYSGGNISGSVGILYQSVEDSDAYRGCRVSTFAYAGEQSARTIADMLANNCTDAALAEYFRFMASRQVKANGDALAPVLLVQILMGGNDAQDTADAILYGRGDGFGNGNEVGVPSNTEGGFVINTASIINRLRDIWVAVCGYAESDLYFLIGGYHPQAVSPQAGFVGSTMVAAMESLCADADYAANVAGVNGYALKTAEQFRDTFTVATRDAGSPFFTETQEAYYNNPVAPDLDEAHLSEAGYQAWGRVVVSAILESG
jgi:hypothetical protein